MSNALFRQSDVEDPFGMYAGQLLHNPVYWDKDNKCWALYSYQTCKALLTSHAALVPPVSTEGLNDYALAITARLVRLSNSPGHMVARQAVLLLFQSMQAVAAREIMSCLLPRPVSEIDWVNTVAKKLPVLHILAGFGMGNKESALVAGRMAMLIQLMQPVKTGAQLTDINTVAKDIYCLLEKHIQDTPCLTQVIRTLVANHPVSTEEALALCISNLAGLLIQCYDAGRGILSNALLYFLRAGERRKDGAYLMQCITETLRFDPPVHNTRRIAGEDMIIHGHEIKKGQMILAVMAAANRDEKQFSHPAVFDAARVNNDTHLTFGAGPHACPAALFSTQMTAGALEYIFQHAGNITLLETTIQYEPLVNVRLPVKMQVAFSP